MIYSLFIASSIISFVLRRKKRQLQDRGDDKRLSYYFVKNSLEFFAPLSIATGLYTALLLFVSLVSERASAGYLQKLETTLETWKSFYSAHIKLSLMQVMILLAVLYISGLFLISAETSKQLDTFFKKGRLWLRRVYVLLVLLCSFTFFGIQPGDPATDLSVHIKTIRGEYSNLRKNTRAALAKAAANQLVTKIQSQLPPSYHNAVSLASKTESEKVHLQDSYAKAQHKYEVKVVEVESILAKTRPAEAGGPGSDVTDKNYEVADENISEADSAQVTETEVRSAEAEASKVLQELPAPEFEFPNAEGAKRLLAEVPKAFSSRAKSALFSSLIKESSFAEPIIDVLLATFDDKVKAKWEETIDRAMKAIMRNPANAPQAIKDEASGFVKQAEVKIPPEAINTSERLSVTAGADLATIQRAQTQMESDIKRVQDARAEALIAKLHSPGESERKEAARELSAMGEELSKEKVNELVSTMRRGGQTWRKFLYREGHCDFFEYTSVKYYAADALEGMKSPYVSDEIAREASRCKDTSVTTNRITDPGWI